MSYMRCCVPGCTSQETVLHDFPNPTKDIDRFMKWRNSISGDILKLSNEYICSNRRVCRKHFDPMYLCRYNRLSKIAVPTINMPCLSKELSLEKDLQPSTLMGLSSSNASGHLRQIQHLPKKAPSQFTPVTKDDNVRILSESKLRSQDKENIEIKMATVICVICLRTNITAVNISAELKEFIDGLCDNNIIEKPRYCTICAHLLKKFYNFKQRCLKACKILKSLKGRQKQVYPTNLHEQIPSSIGFCSKEARYKLLAHQYHTNPDLIKPDSNIKSNIIVQKTPSSAKVCNKQNLETTDPIRPNDIELKDEPMQEIPDSDITMQIAERKNIYIITTSAGYITSGSNFGEKPKDVKLKANKEKVESETNEDASKDNAKTCKINDYIKNFGEEIKELEDDSVDADDTKFTDTTFMLNDDALRDNAESLNLVSRTDVLHKTIYTKIKVDDIHDLKLAELLFKIDRKNKLLKKRVLILRDKGNITENVLKMFKNDEYDLGDGVKISKEIFLKMFEKCEKSVYFSSNCFKYKDSWNKDKTVKFLNHLHRLYNPDYETVFDIEYLDTEEKKLQDFNRRKERSYQNYRCDRCYTEFQAESLLDYHMKKHDESYGAHECHICTLRFPSALARRKHFITGHTAVYTCKICNVTFYYFTSMLNHYSLHKGKQFPCPMCDGIYKTKTGLANHKRTHVTSHVCTTCAKSFVSPSGLALHRKIKHKGAPEGAGEGGVQCAQCPLTLDSQLAYKRHLTISHRALGFPCRCGQKFTTIAELKRHKEEAGHQHSTRGTSEYYGPRPKSQNPRKRRVQKEDLATKTCPVCNEEISNSSAALYRHHMRHHRGVHYQRESSYQPNYLCDQCGRRFLRRGEFEDHKNLHTGARPYICTECGKAYAIAARLLLHSKRHEPASFQCKLCSKLFKSSSSLYAHMRIHINDRRYKCDACSACFIYSSSLKEHIRGVHQNQRKVKKKKQK